MGIPKTHEVDLFNRALSRVGDARLVLETPKAITAITAANPPSVSVAAHGWSDADRVLIFDMANGVPSELNGRVFEIDSTGAGTFTLPRETGVGYLAGGAGFAARLPATKAARTCFDAWARVRDEVIRAHPWNSVVRRTRLARLATATTITAATLADPCVISSAAHGLTSGDTVLITMPTGMTEIDGRYFVVTVLTAGTFSIPVNATTFTAFGTGSVRRVLTPIAPDFGYGCRYDLPEDCERVLSFEEDPDALWETEGRQVLTDIGPTVPIRYARKITDPDLFDAQLTNVLCERLAYEICEELTQSSSKTKEIRDALDAMMLPEAKRLDAQEQSGMDFAEDAWVLARL